MPRFVVLHHTFPPGHPRSGHWDLMLERDGVLATWALEMEPCLGRDQSCESLPDHRLAYLDHEGPVSGGRGAVRRFDSGDYEIVADTEGSLVVEVHGELLRGRMSLIRAGAPQRWTLSWFAP